MISGTGKLLLVYMVTPRKNVGLPNGERECTTWYKYISGEPPVFFLFSASGRLIPITYICVMSC